MTSGTSLPEPTGVVGGGRTVTGASGMVCR
jgi:hypothetical protein